MWITLFLVSLIWFSKTQAVGHCKDVIHDCHHVNNSWIRCYEERIATCSTKGLPRGPMSTFVHLIVNSSQEAEASVTLNYKIHVPSTALRRSRGAVIEEEVMLVASVINSTFFKPHPSAYVPSPRPGKGRMAMKPDQPTHRQGTILGGEVLFVKVGKQSVKDLSQPIKLTFKHKKQVENGTCVFWQESVLGDGTGHWITDGCDTSDTGTEFICSCNHLSFFAVLVNPVLSVDKSNAVNLSYITYIGSALSIFFTVISFIMYICLQRRRPEKAIGVHMQLTGALLCLHLGFLLSCFWVRQLDESQEDWVCRGLGLFLHWSLLATFSWMALEGFHLYLLLVRVFNIYVRRYLLKISLVGWGFPTLTAVVCGISGVYGKYSLVLRDDNNQNSTSQICWMSSQRILVSYITTVAFPCLVILCNSCMLGLVVFKLRGLRGGEWGDESTSGRRMNKAKRTRLWKDCATVLGLSCVLGLPWGLASTTYISLPGIYVFTILNSLQGVFMFLWSMALTCKNRSDDKSSSVRDPSTQKMMTTSFNN